MPYSFVWWTSNRDQYNLVSLHAWLKFSWHVTSQSRFRGAAADQQSWHGIMEKREQDTLSDQEGKVDRENKTTRDLIWESFLRVPASAWTMFPRYELANVGNIVFESCTCFMTMLKISRSQPMTTSASGWTMNMATMKRWPLQLTGWCCLEMPQWNIGAFLLSQHRAWMSCGYLWVNWTTLATRSMGAPWFSN